MIFVWASLFGQANSVYSRLLYQRGQLVSSYKQLARYMAVLKGTQIQEVAWKS